MSVCVAAVLRSGGVYDPTWARRLHHGVSSAYPYADFVCLTDEDMSEEWARPLEHDWPKWWAKLEMFRPGVFDPGTRVIYLDLDSLVVGPLYDLAAWAGGFLMLADFTREIRARRRERPRIGESGVMLFEPDAATERLYHLFASDPERWMSELRMDGKFIRKQIEHEYIQDHFPGQVVSFKYDAEEGPPDGARIVCAHGTPKWHEPEAGWAHRVWENLDAEGLAPGWMPPGGY